MPSWAKPNHIVLGYSGYWFDDLYPPEAYNYDGLTHIARAFLVPHDDGTIPVPGCYFDPALTQGAKEHGVKLIASLGGGALGPDTWYSIAKNSDNRQRFFEELEKLIDGHGYDGVDVDWEPGAANRDQEAVITGFMKALRVRFPKWTITTALMAGEEPAQFIDWKELSSCVDYFNLMAYDYAGNWGENSAYPANLFPSSVAERNSGYSSDQVVTLLLDKYHVNPQQLLMGLPFYGRQFFTKELGDPFQSPGPKALVRHYYEIAPMLKNKKFKYRWDESAQEPILEETQGEGVVGFDDPKSVARKCRYVEEKKLGGVIIWNLGADMEDGKAALLDAVAVSFGSARKAFPAIALKRIHSAFQDMIQGSWDALSKMKERLVDAGEDAAAKKADPGPKPRRMDPPSGSQRQWVDRLDRLQARLADLEQKTFDAWKTAFFLPHYEKAGVKPVFKGEGLLIDDFEKDSKRWKTRKWIVLTDNYHLGSKAQFETVSQGCPESPGSAGHFSGHLGLGRQPYPWTLLEFSLDQWIGVEPVWTDLSDFRAIQFWAKGDGGIYHLTLGQGERSEEAYYGVDFTAGKEWKKIILPFSKFHSLSGVSSFSWENQFFNPGSGRPVPLSFFLFDVGFISFGPVNATGDVDFDLTLDQVMLVK